MFLYDILVRKNASLGFKNKKFKKSKNSHFSKGFNHFFQSKNGHCSNFFFQAIQARKMSFTIFQNKKTTIQFTKTRSSKSPKIDIFSKGLRNRFGPKMATFPSFFFFQAIQARIMSFTIFYKEKTPFQSIKTRSSKRRKIDIF